MNRSPVRDWELEQFALHELGDTRAAQVARELEADSQLRARLAALEASNAAILAAHPPEVIARAIRARHRAGVPDLVLSRGRRRRLLLLLPAAAAAGLVVAVLRLEPALTEDRTVAGSKASTERTKGLRPALVVYRQRAGVSEALANGARVRTGDVLQLKYVAAGRPYGVIVSIDGSGGVTLHFPEEAAASTRMASEGTAPSAYELDDASGFERFILVTATRPIEVAEVLARARAFARRSDAAVAPFDAGAGYEEWSMLVRKVP